MDLSPNDIRNFEFNTQMRGYDKDDVRNFLDEVAAALESMKQHDMKLSMEIDSLNTQISGLRQFEDTIKSAAIDARRNADITMDTAKKEAEAILAGAKAEAEELIGSREDRVTQFEGQISELQATKRSYLDKLRDLIQSHLEMIDEIACEDPDISASDDVEVTESSDVTREKLETIGDEPPSAEPVVAEEANAADTIVKAESEERIEDADKPVDPELAAALESYKIDHSPQAEEEASPPQPQDPAPGEIIETNALAEDIPDGFVVGGETGDYDGSSTGRIATEKVVQTDSAEPNAIDIDNKPAMSPDDLADELDKVAAKFEEEMDKASQDH